MSTLKKFALRLIERCGGFKVLHWLHRSTPLILMYHRIIDQPFIAGISPSEFERQLAYITKRFRVVSVDTMLKELTNNTLKPFTIALTFDDGHYDFYQHAWPILKRYNIAASLYITTGFVNGIVWLWPDLLKYILLNSNNKTIGFSPLGTLDLNRKHFDKNWHQLGDYCLTLSSEVRLAALHRLAEYADVTLPQAPAAPFTAVTWEQLKEMQQEGLDIGSHTVTHSILSSLNATELSEELLNSANNIKNVLGQFPKAICYPNGRLIDINHDVIEQAQKAGYQYGLLASNVPIDKDAPFLIGRLASNMNFSYFKWTLCHRPSQQNKDYIE